MYDSHHLSGIPPRAPDDPALLASQAQLLQQLMEGRTDEGKLLRGCSVFCGLLLLWQLACYSGIPTFLLPSPAAVAEALWNNRSYLASHTLITLSEILSGMALGVALGMVFSVLYDHVSAITTVGNAAGTDQPGHSGIRPRPLLVLWFGFGMSAKVMMAVLVIFFPVTSAFFDGLQRVNRDYLDLARTMGASFGAQVAPCSTDGGATRARFRPADGRRRRPHWRDYWRMGRLRRGARLRNAECQCPSANRYQLRPPCSF
ncbi:ABC transporter permease [Klebsiella aerogenes]|nr:ABC transporter permease [Klebsiella aerogenes]